METFNIPYREIYQFKSSWSTTVTDLSSGKEQRIANWDHPRQAWAIEMEKTLEIIDQARVFFDARRGKYEAFWFLPPKKNPTDVPVPVKVRFDTDDFEASITYTAGTFTLTVIEVL
jgi:hypothetical protein